MDYPNIVKALLLHFIQQEGTDHLAAKGVVEDSLDFPGLTEAERVELTRLRDEVRTTIGRHGYDQPVSPGDANDRSACVGLAR